MELPSLTVPDKQQGRMVSLTRKTGCTSCLHHPTQCVTGRLPRGNRSRNHQQVPPATHARRTKPELGRILAKIYLHDVHSDMRRHQTSPEPSVGVSPTVSRHDADVWATAGSLYKPTPRNSEPSRNESVQNFSQDKIRLTPFWFLTFPQYFLVLRTLTFPSSEWGWTECQLSPTEAGKHRPWPNLQTHSFPKASKIFGC